MRKSNIWRADRDQCSRADEQLRSAKGVARAAWRRREVGGQGPIRSEEERKKATDGQTESETAGERLCRIKRVRNSSNSTLCRRSVSPSPSVQRRARSPEYARWRQFKVAAASCGGEASREALSKAGSHFHPSNCGWPHRTADGRTDGRTDDGRAWRRMSLPLALLAASLRRSGGRKVGALHFSLCPRERAS